MKPTRRLALLAPIFCAFSTPLVHADSSSWAVDSDGLWTDDTKWTGGIIANDVGFTATFNNNITANRVVTLNGDRTIGNITFGDNGNAAGSAWTLTGDKITLDTTTGTPTITGFTNATINSVLAGNDGLRVNTASGIRLTLGGANTFTGPLTIRGNSTTNNYDSENLLLASGASLATTTINIGEAANTNSALAHGGANQITNAVVNLVNNPSARFSFWYLRGYDQSVVGITGGGSTSIIANSNGLAVSTPSAITITGDGTYAYAGAINNLGNTLGLTMASASGTGVQTLSGSTTYLGGTNITSGTLALGHADNTLSNTGAVTVNGGSAVLSLGANSDTVGAVSLKNGGSITSSTGSTGTLTGSSYAFESGSVSAKLGGTGALNKTTGGTVTLSGTNTYTGATTIKAGTLALSGSGSVASTSIVVGDTGSSGAILDVTAISGGTFTVGASQSVSGIGTINAGTKVVSVGGALAPGNSAGVLSVSTTAPVGLQFLNNGSLNIELTRGLAPAAGSNYDQLGLNGTLSIDSGADLNLSALGTGTYTLNSIYFLIANDGSDAISGEFQGFTEGGQITFDSQLFKVTYDADSGTNSFVGGNDFALMAVPEPAAALLGGMGLLALLRRRRA